MNLVSGVAIAFLLIYLAVGIYASRSLKGVSDFYVMDRNAPAFLITGTLIATNVSSVTFVGFTGGAFSSGPLPFVTFFGMTIVASLFVGFYLGRYLWRSGLWTVPDYLAKRYPSKGVQGLGAVIVLLSMVLYLIAIMQGVGIAAAAALGWSERTSVLVILLIIAAFTFLGGMRGVVLTDTIMFIVVFLAALTMVPYIVIEAGGWPTAFRDAAVELPGFTDWGGDASTFDAVWFLIETNVLSLILVIASPQLLSRVYIARDERTLARAMLYQAFLLPVFIFGFLYVFGVAPLAVPEGTSPADAFPYVATVLVPALVGAIALSGVVAAAMSTASSLFQQGSAALSRDIYQRFVNPDVSEQSFLRISRVSVLVLGVVVYLGAAAPQVTSASIVYGFLFASAAWAVWLPAIVAGVMWRNATTAGALWSMSIGLVLAVGAGLGRNFEVSPAWIPPNFVGLVTATIVLVVVSRMTAPSPVGQAMHDAMKLPTVDAQRRIAEGAS